MEQQIVLECYVKKSNEMADTILKCLSSSLPTLEMWRNL